MRKHSGMRPHDIVILLKIISLGGGEWQFKDLAASLYLSASEISESLGRSLEAALIDFNRKRVNRQNLFEFLEHGFKYVFPQHPGAIAKGYPTAHAHPFMKKFFTSETSYIWPDVHGPVRGQIIQPLYPKQVKAISEDASLYKMLALLDVIRVGKVREIKVAAQELRKMILNEPA